MQRCNATVDFLEQEKPLFPATINNKNLHKHFQNVAGNMLGVHNVKDMQPLMGSEDFAFYQEEMPGYFFFIGMKDEAALGRLPSVHSPHFKINEEALPYGAALHASLAATYLLEIQLRASSPEGKHHDEL